MADNKQAGAAVGAGPTFATDEIAGVDYPRTKVVWGVDGTAVDASASNPLPVVQTGTPALPTGAATAAKQPALGTAGSPSADVISIQGVSSMTAVKTDGSGVTQPVSDAGGSLTIDTPQLPAALVSGRLSVDGSGVTQPISASALPLPTGAATETTLAALNTKTATAKTSDYDTGAGTDTVPMMGIALPASGGAVQGGTATNPVRTDPTGTTTQPVSDAGGSLTVDSAQLPSSLGQKTMANSLGVALASDQSTLPVSLASVPSHAVTNAGTFAVQADGSVASGSADSGAPVKVGGKYNSTPITLSNGQRGDAQLDANGYLKVNVAAGGASGGTSSSFGSAFPSTGTAIGAKDSTGTNMVALNLDASGNLKVNLAAGGGSGGTALSDKAAFTEGSTSHTPIGGVYNETISADPTEDQAAAVRITAKRALHVNLRDSSGNELAAGSQYNEDDPHTSGDKVTMAGVVRHDANTSLVSADGDIACLQVNAAGQLKTDGSAVTQPVSDAGGSLTVDSAQLPSSLGQKTMANSMGVVIASDQSALSVTDVPATSGGWTASKTISGASTNATSVKGSAGQVGGWYLYNANAAARYLKLYNKATAPTVGTDTPVITIPIPPGSAANVEFGKGIAFGTGIALAITTGVADSDTGAVAANEIVVNLMYK